MGNTEWLPIAELPDALKDGREVLLKADGGSVVAEWSSAAYFGNGGWIGPKGLYPTGVSHFAGLTAPQP